MTDPEPARIEAVLIRRILQGETELYCELIRPCQRMIYAAAFSILRDRTEAEDVVQQTLLNGLSALRSFRGKSTISTWLTKIAINEARQRLRRARLSRSVSIEEVSMTGGPGAMGGELVEWRRIPSHALERKETRRALVRAFESLPRIYREALALRDVEELSIRETARLLGIREQNVKTRLSRARLKMKELIAEALAPRPRPAASGRLPSADCRLVWREASNFIDDDLTRFLRRRITAHLRQCLRCKSVIAGIRNVIQLMSDPRTLALPRGFSARLESRLNACMSRTKPGRIVGRNLRARRSPGTG